MEYTAVNKCAITLKDHTTVFALMVMSLIVMDIHVMVRIILPTCVTIYVAYNHIMLCLCTSISMFYITLGLE